MLTRFNFFDELSEMFSVASLTHFLSGVPNGVDSALWLVTI